jgi:tetratricopeptide (TPR) repeat protein
MKSGFIRALLPVAIALLAAGCAHRPSYRSEGMAKPKVATEISYDVQSGDSWARISELYFGGPQHAERLALVNETVAGIDPPVGRKVRVVIEPAQMDLVRRVEEARGPYNAGTELLAAANNGAALDAFRRALRLAPELVDARYNEALALLALERADEAIESLKKVLRQRPSDKEAHYALASAHFHGGDFASALSAVDAALLLDPVYLRALYTRALALERLGRGDAARAAWQAYLELDDTSAWAEEARAHLRDLS